MFPPHNFQILTARAAEQLRSQQMTERRQPPELSRPGASDDAAPGQLTRAAHNKLREAFAAQALCGLLSSEDINLAADRIAAAAWKIADAMMAARTR